jgi:hypothetical protein
LFCSNPIRLAGQTGRGGYLPRGYELIYPYPGFVDDIAEHYLEYVDMIP